MLDRRADTWTFMENGVTYGNSAPSRESFAKISASVKINCVASVRFAELALRAEVTDATQDPRREHRPGRAIATEGVQEPQQGTVRQRC